MHRKTGIEIGKIRTKFRRRRGRKGSIIISVEAGTQEGIELRTDGHGVVERRQWLGRNSVQESSVHQLFEEELYVAQLRVLDAERF